ncbi:MAG: alpha/beta hydrolase [Chitinophagaceae bacterium]|nr:alpha/beta hydrolase [Chitinophagaceae bacterium]
MKIIFLVLNIPILLISGKSFANEPYDTTYKNFDYEFKVTEGKLSLKGVLSIPTNFKPADKLVILVSPPVALDRNYSGLFTAIADVMCKRGIAVLRFDNRAYTFPVEYPKDSLSMVDQAADVQDAVKSLKLDKRFKNAKIGLVGHSEGGSSVAIVASEDNVDFVIMLSAMGISGKQLSLYQFSTSLTKEFPFIDHISKKRIISDWESQLNIVSTINNIDSIKFLLKRNLDSLYKEDAKTRFGKMTFEEVVEYNMKLWVNNHRMLYTKFAPELYYSKIKCPVLFVFGRMDEKLDYQTNTKNIVCIFKNVHKTNYDLLLIDSLDHSYRVISNKPTDTSGKKYRRSFTNIIHQEKKSEFSISTISKIASWINKL